MIHLKWAFYLSDRQCSSFLLHLLNLETNKEQKRPIKSKNRARQERDGVQSIFWQIHYFFRFDKFSTKITVSNQCFSKLFRWRNTLSEKWIWRHIKSSKSNFNMHSIPFLREVADYICFFTICEVVTKVSLKQAWRHTGKKLATHNNTLYEKHCNVVYNIRSYILLLIFKELN